VRAAHVYVSTTGDVGAACTCNSWRPQTGHPKRSHGRLSAWPASPAADHPDAALPTAQLVQTFQVPPVEHRRARPSCMLHGCMAATPDRMLRAERILGLPATARADARARRLPCRRARGAPGARIELSGAAPRRCRQPQHPATQRRSAGAKRGWSRALLQAQRAKPSCCRPARQATGAAPARCAAGTAPGTFHLASRRPTACRGGSAAQARLPVCSPARGPGTSAARPRARRGRPRPRHPARLPPSPPSLNWTMFVGFSRRLTSLTGTLVLLAAASVSLGADDLRQVVPQHVLHVVPAERLCPKLEALLVE
jgi:hypothetical protein